MTIDDYILSQGDTRGTPHLAEAICKGTVLQKEVTIKSLEALEKIKKRDR